MYAAKLSLQHMCTLQVDAAGWYAEVERLAPALSRITLPADDAVAGLWLQRWQQTTQHYQNMQQQSGVLIKGVSEVHKRVLHDMERIQQTEDRLQRTFQQQLGRL